MFVAVVCKQLELSKINAECHNRHSTYAQSKLYEPLREARTPRFFGFLENRLRAGIFDPMLQLRATGFGARLMIPGRRFVFLVSTVKEQPL